MKAWGIRALNFVRGDATGDLAVEVSDAVSILEHLFRGGVLPCVSSADSNDDGEVDIGDALHVLFFLFAGGHAPPPPFPRPGSDPTPDALPCRQADPR